MNQRNLIFSVSFCLLITAAAVANADPCELTSDVVATLKRCIPGIGVKPTSPAFKDPKRSYFEVSFQQFVDHEHPELGSFQQRLILAHRSYDEPLVLQTSGYLIFQVAPTLLTTTYDTNQIQVEHRFFETSTPASKDWSKLNIRQSAADFHRITEAFKRVYGKAWVNTGASKGGMTSIYHRRFYPSDLEGTVADVAPLSFGTADPRYIEFVEQVGGDRYQACRDKLSVLQSYLLRNRERFEGSLNGKFDHLGGKDTAFEHAVQEMPFFFWQYHSPKKLCFEIPGPDNTDSEVLAFFNRINPLDGNYGDLGIQQFAAYYYQAATELGSPALKRNHLDGLLKYPYTIDQYAPKDIDYHYSDASMRDVAAWVENTGQGLMLTYGEFDPWSAGRFPIQCANDCHWNTVPEANHGANIFLLPKEQKTKALEIVAGWISKSPVKVRLNWDQSLDALEFEVRRRNRI